MPSLMRMKKGSVCVRGLLNEAVVFRPGTEVRSGDLDDVLDLDDEDRARSVVGRVGERLQLFFAVGDTGGREHRVLEQHYRQASGGDGVPLQRFSWHLGPVFDEEGLLTHVARVDVVAHCPLLSFPYLS